MSPCSVECVARANPTANAGRVWARARPSEREKIAGRAKAEAPLLLGMPYPLTPTLTLTLTITLPDPNLNWPLYGVQV